MAKHKNKIIVAIVVLAVLAGAWVFGGEYSKNTSGGSSLVSPQAEAPLTLSADSPYRTLSPESEPFEPVTDRRPDQEGEGSQQNDVEQNELRQEVKTALTQRATGINAASAHQATEIDATHAQRTAGIDAATAQQAAEIVTAPAQQTTEIVSSLEQQEMEIDPDTGRDKYLTEPAPDGKPKPVEPNNAIRGDGEFTVVLSLRCDTLLNNMNLLNKEKHELVPTNGVIFPEAYVTVYEGESVFNILQREMKRAKIHMEFVNTPIYNSAYIEGINNLYEFDAGELSGWIYRVNGWFPNYGCSRYQLKPGDILEWLYTCDNGRDLGEYWLNGSQRDE